MSDKPDALSPENALPVLVIQASRMYDALMALIRLQNPDVYRNILQAHAEGKILTPDPAYMMEEYDGDDSSS